MSRRGRDAKARDRRHRAAVAQRSESSARTGLAMAPVARASDVEAKPVVAAYLGGGITREAGRSCYRAPS